MRYFQSRSGPEQRPAWRRAALPMSANVFGESLDTSELFKEFEDGGQQRVVVRLDQNVRGPDVQLEDRSYGGVDESRAGTTD